MSEVRSYENNITISKISKEKLKLSGGSKHKNTSRPHLYKDSIGAGHKSRTSGLDVRKNVKKKDQVIEVRQINH